MLQHEDILLLYMLLALNIICHLFFYCFKRIEEGRIWATNCIFNTFGSQQKTRERGQNDRRPPHGKSFPPLVTKKTDFSHPILFLSLISSSATKLCSPIECVLISWSTQINLQYFFNWLLSSNSCNCCTSLLPSI